MTMIGNVAPSFNDLGINMILGGFGLFMLGIKMLGDGFQAVAGPRIREYIEKYTGNLLSAIAVGAVITALMHSSTAATVISISLVRAGLMSLEQAIGISIGANVGTTITALMIGFNIESLGYYFLFAGAMVMVFSSRKKNVNYGSISFAFGITFVGLQIMGDKLALLQNYQWFEDFMVLMSQNSWLALLAGTLLTAIVNSSTAIIALVQKIYASGGMTMVAASGFVFGSNVGTTLTAILASLGGSVSTKRAGWFHVIYNIIGALLMMLIIVPYSNFIEQFNTMLSGTLSFGVGLNHFVFNIISTVLVIPFVPVFIRLLTWMIPGEDKIQERDKLVELDPQLIYSFPEGALKLVQQAIVQMSDLVSESIRISQSYLKSRDAEDGDVVMQLEGMVNQIDDRITHYLLEIAKATGTENIAVSFMQYLEVVKNYERISDLSTNTVEIYAMVIENKESFSPGAIDELNQMYQHLLMMMEHVAKMIKTGDLSDFETLVQAESYLDLIEQKFREKHFQRMAQGICVGRVSSSLFVDLLGILERVGDHALNIGQLVKNREPHQQKEHSE